MEFEMCSRRRYLLNEFENICIIVVLSLLFAVSTVDTHGLTFQYMDSNKRILTLQCDGSMLPPDSIIMFITIYNGTSMTSMAQVKVGECPSFLENPVANDIYTPACVPGKIEALPILKLIFIDLDTSTPQTFGCNLTTRHGTSGHNASTSWTISLEMTASPPVTNERTAESRSQPTDKSGKLQDSYLTAYVMGFAILALVLALATAMCYIGLHTLRSRRGSVNGSSGRRSSRPIVDTDLQNEEEHESGNRTDVGCERSLICPTTAFRRPSYQEYSEPLSPTLSAISDFVGIDFMHVQLANQMTTASILRFPGNSSEKSYLISKKPLNENITESHISDMEGNICGGVSDGHMVCRSESVVVFLEHSILTEQECSVDNGICHCRRAKIGNESSNREITQRA